MQRTDPDGRGPAASESGAWQAASGSSAGQAASGSSAGQAASGSSAGRAASESTAGQAASESTAGQAAPEHRGTGPAARTASSRRERSAQTRAAIIAAAHEQFLESGYAGTTIAAIARRAGVAPQTVYFVFHTKSALISAVIDAAVMGADSVPPEQTEWWAAMTDAATGHAALRHFTRGAGALYAGAAGISEVLRTAAASDPECRETWLRHDRLQVAGFRQVVDVIAAKTPLRAGLDAARATDVLITVFGDSVFHLLTAEREWTAEQTITWMTDALPLLLLEPETSNEA